MTNEHSKEDLSTPIYNCVFRGRTEDGMPLQRVYVTDDKALASAFRLALQQEAWGLKRLDGEISSQFPGLYLLKEETGNDVTPFEEATLPEELPFGEGIWDEQDHVQLLKRALTEHYNVWHDSKRRRNNELASNLPTFYAAAAKADNNLLIAASIGGIAVAAAIQWRGHHQKQKFIETLKIWVEYENNLRSNPLLAVKVLEEQMRDGGLLFSGIPNHDLGQFPYSTFKQTAEDLSLWYDKGYLQNKRSLKLPSEEDCRHASIKLHCVTIPKILNGAYNLVTEQIIDLYKNPRPETAKTIFKGLKDTGPLVARHLVGHFAQKAMHKYSEFRHLHPENGAPKTDKEEHLRQIRIEKCNVIMSAADPVHKERLFTVLKQAKKERADGAILALANGGESLFMGMHCAAFGGAVADFASDTPEPPETWIDEPVAMAILSLGSIALASGAYAHIGHEVSQIKATLESRAAEASEKLRPQIIKQYLQRQRDNQPETPEI